MNRICLIGGAALAISLASCTMLGGNSSSAVKTTAPNDGQLHGVSPARSTSFTRPVGMVYVKGGSFHMGPSDEDMNYTYTARNKAITISGFWMDRTEITNNQYRQFTNWVRDSIGSLLLGYKKTDKSGKDAVDWNRAKTIKWSDPSVADKIDAIILTPDNRINNRKELDAQKIVYQYEVFDYLASARNRDVTKTRSNFIIKKAVPVYPDSLCWVRDLAYSYNEPMAKNYFSNAAFGNYPVVGVNWHQANAFCDWRTQYMNAFLESKKKSRQPDFRLPSEAQWEYAARGGRSQSPYPWGGPYLRNKKGCLLANFKPGRGNYAEDGGLYTVRADAYWPNAFGLYNMAGNVAEWTCSLYYEGSYNFQHDMNPDIRWNAKDSDPPRMKRKVVRGGSWKDVGYFLQTGTRSYEYQDSSKSYIGFRCVQDMPPVSRRK